MRRPRAGDVSLRRGQNPPIGIVVTERGQEYQGDFAATLGAAQHGEAWALRELFDWLGAPVAGFLRSRGAHDPDGSANEVFLRAFRTVHTFRGDAYQFRTWVFTITRNLLIDERRRAARRPELVLVDSGRRSGSGAVGADVAGPDLVGGDAEADALAALGDDRVAELLAHLSPDQREVIALRVVADLSVEQVAAITGRGYEAVKALQRRGLAALRRAIEREAVPR